jgi:hypothetical protein
VAASRDERIRDDVELRPRVLLPLVGVDFAAHRVQLVGAWRNEARQPRHHAPVRQIGACAAPVRGAVELAPGDAKAPFVVRARGAHLEVVQHAPEHVDASRLDVEAVELEHARRRRRGRCGLRRLLAVEREPLVDVEVGNVPAHPDASAVRSTATRDRAAQQQKGPVHGARPLGKVTVRDDANVAAVVDGQRVLEALARGLAALDANGRHLVGQLADRRREFEIGAFEVGLDHPARRVAARLRGELPIGIARDAAAHRQVELARQRREVRRARRTDAHAAFLRCHGDLREAAEHIRGEIARLHAALRKLEMSVDLREHGQPRHSEGIGHELVIAAHLRAIGIAERQRDLQRELALAGGLRTFGDAPDPLADGTLVHEAQEVRRRTRRFAGDHEQRMQRPQVRDVGLHGPELHTHDAPGPRGDRHARAFEPDIAVDRSDLRPSFHVIEQDVACLERDQELALLRIGKRKVREVARQ